MYVCEDKTSPEFQRQAWEALRKSINGLVNKALRWGARQLVACGCILGAAARGAAREDADPIRCVCSWHPAPAICENLGRQSAVCLVS